MKSFLSIFFLFVITSTVITQQPTATPRLYSSETLENMKRIQAAALESDQAYSWTAHLTNNIGPRLSGSKQILQAERYVADEMRKLGFEVKMQPVKVPHWERGTETGELTEFPGMATGTTQKIVLTALGGSVATPENGLTAEIVVVSSIEELNRLGADGVRGKIVLFNSKFDRLLAASGFGLQAYGQAVRQDKQDGIRPLVISHGANSPRTDRSRFHLEFDWVGTADPTPYLCVPTAIQCLGAMLPGGWPALISRNRAMTLSVRQLLCQQLQVALPCPDALIGSMATIPLPAGPATAASWQTALFERFRIEIPVIPWQNKRLIRISVQLYNSLANYESLAEALKILHAEEQQQSS
ncbi:hypothetical protein [Leptolyngbya sp. 7M]|uniref:hypothetical protein n=1 Tax=Leptolyngbya sp. 7M TaxID=2812896 RepID=UPI001B8D8A80|nr:hypothetical protein [Leptolyngbya sp. 7M]QYO64727.1 hypothetical protein JVX88_34880 [Leptolyngbya sp. 7M]